MNHKCIIIIIMIALSLSQSCKKDFLDLKPVSSLTNADFFKDATDAEAAVNACYNLFTGGYWQEVRTYFTEVSSDNCWAGGDNPDNFSIDNFTVTSINSYLDRAWVDAYDLINRTNNVISNVPGINDPKLDVNGRRTQIVGEASFLRALYYFELVRLWGGVPLKTEPTTTADPAALNLPKASVDQIYAQITKDLETAVADLPDKYADDAQTHGRATKGAANALLAQVYATTKDWNKTKQYCDAVISSPVYQLLPDYTQLFDGNHYNNSESILEVQFQSPNFGSYAPELFLSPLTTGETYKRFNLPTADLIAAYNSENDQVRLNASVLFETVTTDQYTTEWGTTKLVPFWYKQKYSNGYSSSDHIYILRLAEIILLRAEAENELNDPTDALADLKTVRDRVHLPVKTPANQSDFRTAVYKERRLELAFECYRWYDLLRTGTAVSVMSALGYTISAKNLLFPLPQTELDRNPNMRPQNPGY